MISAILIGIGIGAIASSAYNYKTDNHKGIISTKAGLVVGSICLVVGLIIHFS